MTTMTPDQFVEVLRAELSAHEPRYRRIVHQLATYISCYGDEWPDGSNTAQELGDLLRAEMPNEPLTAIFGTDPDVYVERYRANYGETPNGINTDNLCPNCGRYQFYHDGEDSCQECGTSWD